MQRAIRVIHRFVGPSFQLCLSFFRNAWWIKEQGGKAPRRLERGQGRAHNERRALGRGGGTVAVEIEHRGPPPTALAVGLRSSGRPNTTLTRRPV